MTKLDDADVFTILNMGEYCSYHNFMYPEADGYDVSKQLSILAMSYYIQSQVMQMTLGSEYDDNYSRAVAFMAAADYMCTVGAGCNHYIFYNTKEHSNGKKIYNLNLSVDKSYAPESSWFYDRKITIYPFGDPKANDSYLKDAANGNISTFQTSIIRKMGKDALDKSVGFILDELNIGGVVQFDTALYISELMNTYHQNVLAQGASQALDYGDAVEAMRISGTVVHVGDFVQIMDM